MNYRQKLAEYFRNRLVNAEIVMVAIEPGWEGIDPIAVTNAKNFVQALPNDVPRPEFAPEPDGSVSLDWIHSRSRVFSLSISASCRLAYALLDGSDKQHGVALFDGCNVPPRVLEGIRSIISKEGKKSY